jgi:hypothetical protein
MFLKHFGDIFLAQRCTACDNCLRSADSRERRNVLRLAHEIVKSVVAVQQADAKQLATCTFYEPLPCCPPVGSEVLLSPEDLLCTVSPLPSVGAGTTTTILLKNK